MINPPFLKPGDKIAIVAPARKVFPGDIEAARKTFQSWGLMVVESPYLFSHEHTYLAGTDQHRLLGLQQMLDDPTVNAIVSARGGYGTTRIVDRLDFSKFKNHPKWIVGFSDITALHLKMATLGFESIHGIMPILFNRADVGDSVESLRKALFGEVIEITALKDVNNKPGTASGKLIGGNLSLIADSLGTKHQIDTIGKILVLEEIDEYLYKVDRMIVQLKRAGLFSHLTGLVVGHFTDIKNGELPFAESVVEIIKYHTTEFNFPVGFYFPIGHQQPNLAWINGGEATLTISYEGSSLKIDLTNKT